MLTAMEWMAGDLAVSSSTGSEVPSLQADQRLLSFLYIAFSSFALFLSLTVILSYLLFPSLRHYPNSFLFHRSIFDSLYSLQFIVFFAIQPYSARAQYCSYFTPLFQFSLLGSTSYYFVLTLDLLLSLRNPFLSLSSSPVYHLYVYTVAIATAVVIPLTGQQGYRDGMEICWLKPSATRPVNAVAWSIFYLPTAAYLLFGVAVVVYAFYRLGGGLEETFKVRSRVLYDSLRYVSSFSVYWLFTFTIYLALWVVESRATDKTIRLVDLDGNLGLYCAFAVSLGLRAALDEVVWLYNNSALDRWRRWWRGSKRRPVISADINEALRREVLVFTTSGMVHAVEVQAAVEEKKSLVPPSPAKNQFPASVASSTASPFSSAAVRHFILRRQSTTPRSSTPVPFTDYAPHVFSHLRRQFNIRSSAYLKSIKGNHERMLEKYTEGRSSAFFYYSEDGQYIVKTLTRSEIHELLRLLPAYVAYMSRQPHSLLCRYVGLHSVQLYNLTLYFVVMQSVFLTPVVIHERYDLKGSTVDRFTGRTGKQAGKVLKDLDLQTNVLLARLDRSAFLQQCEADTLFLSQHGLMDYSLLLGVHYTQHQVGLSTDLEALSAPVSPSSLLPSPSYAHKSPFTRDQGGMRASYISGPSLYFFGVIDMLQQWGIRKRLERVWKVYGRCRRAEGLSVMEPVGYRQRFLRAMADMVDEVKRADDGEFVQRVDGAAAESGDDEERYDGETEAVDKSKAGQTSESGLRQSWKERLLHVSEQKEEAHPEVREAIAAELVDGADDLDEDEEEDEVEEEEG